MAGTLVVVGVVFLELKVSTSRTKGYVLLIYEVPIQKESHLKPEQLKGKTFLPIFSEHTLSYLYNSDKHSFYIFYLNKNFILFIFKESDI